MSEVKITWGSNLPDTEAVSDSDIPHIQSAPAINLEITHSVVYKLLNSRNNSIPRERVANLMLYAYEATGTNPPYEELPERIGSLEVGMEDWINHWVSKNFDGMRCLIKDQREMRYLHEDSEGFEDRYEWVEGADRISRMQPLNDEARIVSAGVRTILIDPDAAFK